MGLRRETGLIAYPACTIIPASDIVIAIGAFLDTTTISANLPVPCLVTGINNIFAIVRRNGTLRTTDSTYSQIPTRNFMGFYVQLRIAKLTIIPMRFAIPLYESIRMEKCRPCRTTAICAYPWPRASRCTNDPVALSRSAIDTFIVMKQINSPSYVCHIMFRAMNRIISTTHAARSTAVNMRMHPG